MASTLGSGLEPRRAEADFTLTVTGSGFVAGSTVEWNGSPRSTTVVSATQLDGDDLCIRHCCRRDGADNRGEPRQRRRHFGSAYVYHWRDGAASTAGSAGGDACTR